MAASAAHANPGEVACPDPSAHEKHNKLSEQASTAALYVTHPERNTHPMEVAAKGEILGPDGKLSSRSAATSLKYARAQDLPSFPSVGIDTSNSAGKAAMVAKDYKMQDLWHPELSSAGSKAALIAAKDGGKLNLWQPTASKDGNSAATLAMRNKGLSPQIDYGYTADGKSRALQAANLSIHRTGAGSTPTPAAQPTYPDSQNSAYNALNAATISHRANSVKAAPDGWNSEANQAARIKNLSKKINPEMFGEHPPWKDDEEDKHQAALRASALSMAKQMYDHNHRTVLGSDSSGVEAAEAAAARQAPTSQVDLKQEALRYIHLQDAAHKLAQERLAKVDKTNEAARYREYYGYPDNNKTEAPPRKPMHRLSTRGRGRKRATSEGGDLSDSDDEEQARRIRTQMSQLGTTLSTVDDKKRSDDRAKLLAAAEKKVHARMQDMDEKVFADTGKITPAMMEEWEAKARKKQQEEKELQAQHPGMQHIGGGKFISQSEIEAIAAARLKPTLDQINETAKIKRARDEELRQEKEENERQKMEEKQKNRLEKEEQKRVKNDEKTAARKEKDEAKARKEEEKRIAKDDKRKSREHKRDETTEVAGAARTGSVAGETADEEVHQDHSDDKLAKRRSGALGRWASKLKRTKKTEDGKAAEDTPETEATTDIVGGTAVGSTVGAAAAADDAHDEHVEKEEHDVSPLSSDEDEFDDPADTTAAGVSFANDTAPSTDAAPMSGKTLRPDLERHISTIQDSDDEDDEAEWGNDEPRSGTLGSDHAHEIAQRVLTSLEDKWADAQDLPETDEQRTGPAGEAGIAATDNSPAARTVGPHDSDVANIVDPRVQPDPVALKESAMPGDTKRTEPAAAPSTSTAAPVPPAIAVPSTTAHPEKDDTTKGGLAGLFNRFRSGGNKKRQSRSEPHQQENPAASHQAPRTSTTDQSAKTTSSTAADPRPSASIPTDADQVAPASPSSFTRGGELRDLDDVSSSGLEEEDLDRGRGGGGRQAGGKFSSVLTGEGAAGASKTADDEEQFEEARDHFDESLAPPPAFAGQAKSQSPVRGTRFREEV